MITERCIANNLLDLLRQDRLTEADLLAYFQRHATLLASNIDSARYLHGKASLEELLPFIFPMYAQHRERILANQAAFAEVQSALIDSALKLFRSAPELSLVPCLGCFSSNGWMENLEGRRHICVALEVSHDALDITLAHETAHTFYDGGLKTILDGFYNEGFAVYVSSLLLPGRAEEGYLFQTRAWHQGCLTWMRDNCQKLLADAAQPFQVMGEHHLFYFGSKFADLPRIGYAIGYEYLKFLHRHHSLDELRTLPNAANEESFREFISLFRGEKAVR